MSTDHDNVRDKQIKGFIQNLSRLDDGERARLKRNAGNTLAESHQVRLLFYQKILPFDVTSEWQEERYFLIATLYPFDKKQRDKDRQPMPLLEGNPKETDYAEAFNTTLGSSFRQALNDTNKAGIDRRFSHLLDADSQQLNFQLRQAIMRLTTEWVSIDWRQLTQDILGWDSSTRYVQRKWARDYTVYNSETR